MQQQRRASMDATLRPSSRSRAGTPASGGDRVGTPAGGGGTWEPSWKWSSSLEDFREFDPDAVIGSPRSMAACDAQGILPRELRYKPLELFMMPGVDPRVAQLRYDFMENRRQDLLGAARSTRQAIIDLAAEAERAQPGDGKQAKALGERTPDLHTTLQPSWDEGGPPDPSLAGAPTTPYLQARAWFHEVLRTYSFSNAAASCPSSPAGSSKGMTGDLEAALPPVSPTSSLGSPLSRMKNRREPRSSITRAASEGEIRGLLDKVRYAPRATRVDQDMSKKSDDLHIVYPALVAKWRRKANSDQHRLTDRRIDMATETFDRLVIQDEENYQSGKLREAMHAQSAEDDPTQLISPSSPAGEQNPPMSPFSTMRSTSRTTLRASQTLSSASRGFAASMKRSGSSMSFGERQDNAREKNLALHRNFEIQRQEALQIAVAESQALKERLVAEDLAAKWRIAQSLLDERVAWRTQFNKVAGDQERNDAFKRDFFQKREEMQRAQRNRVGDTAEMRKEIQHLRDVNRKLNMVQRDRKEAWRHAKKQREQMEKTMAASGVKMSIGKLY